MWSLPKLTGFHLEEISLIFSTLKYLNILKCGARNAVNNMHYCKTQGRRILCIMAYRQLQLSSSAVALGQSFRAKSVPVICSKSRASWNHNFLHHSPHNHATSDTKMFLKVKVIQTHHLLLAFFFLSSMV